MAIVQNPIIGRSKGSFGNAVFSKWKGKNTLRSKALEVANPQTDLQMKQRAKFAILVALYRQLAAVFKAGFRELAVGMSEFNAFQSANLRNAFLNWSGSAWVPSFANLVVSKGSLDVTDFGSITASNASTSINVVYPSAASGNQSSADAIIVLVMKDGTDEVTILDGTRYSGSTAGNLPSPASTGDEYHCYIFGISPDGRKVSDSQYYFLVV